MKNVIMGLLCAALVACVIWGGSLSSEKQGLLKEKADMDRRYAVLQLLYQQGQDEIASVQARYTADKQALEAQANHWREALMKAQGDALPETQETVGADMSAQPEEGTALVLLEPAEDATAPEVAGNEEDALPLAPPAAEETHAPIPDTQVEETTDPVSKDTETDHEEIPVG